MIDRGMVVVDPSRSGGTRPDRGSRSNVGNNDMYICTVVSPISTFSDPY